MRRTYRVARQRGSVYLIVLGACMMVAVLGVGSLLAVRVERRAAQSDGNAATAGYYARSVIDAALLDMAFAPDWRATVTNGAWSNWTTLGRGDCRGKVIDDDGNLKDDPADCVWLYGEGRCGSAVRIMRVQLVPEYRLPGKSEVDRADLTFISNGDDRTFSAPASFIKNVPYRLDAWVRTTSGTADSVRVILEFTTDGTSNGSVDATITPIAGTAYQNVTANTVTLISVLGIDVTTRHGTTLEAGVQIASIGTQWTHVAAIITPTWSGNLQDPPPGAWDGENSSPAWKIKATLSGSGSGGMGELEVRDDVRMVPAGAMYKMTPVAGTWERVVE